jgi:hypothetical protein
VSHNSVVDTLHLQAISALEEIKRTKVQRGKTLESSGKMCPLHQQDIYHHHIIMTSEIHNML